MRDGRYSNANLRKSVVKTVSGLYWNALVKRPLVASSITALPVRVLDAPDFTSDFYLNVMQWCSTSGILAIALQGCCYIWNQQNNETLSKY